MKYEITDTRLEGTNLHRIRALVDIPRYGVKKGDLGGYIESEYNLSQEGDCWVSGNALVFGDAQVSGDALVSGDAWVFDDARVSGNAWVFGDARVSGDALVSGDGWETSPLYIRGSKYSLTNCKHGYIKIGCETHTIDEWLANGVEIGKKNGFNDAEIAEYTAYVELFKRVGK